MTVSIRRLHTEDAALPSLLNALFASVFDDDETYLSAQPRDRYFARILDLDELIALVALKDKEVVAGLVAYALQKLEQERSEIYIYDLAVAEPYRRQGIATALIEELRGIASTVGAWVIYVQADYGDEPAVALYEKLGTREDVMHFDIMPSDAR